MSVWLLRGLLALALATVIAQGSAFVIRDIAAVVEPSPTPTSEPTPEPSEPLPSEEPSPSAVPSAEATPAPDIEVDVDIPLPPLPIPIVPPAPVATPPPVIPPKPVCLAPGGSANDQAPRTGWTSKGRECAGKQDSTPLLVAFLALMLILKIGDARSSAPCLKCGMPASYPMHGRPRSYEDAQNPEYEYHPYDPGERRRLVRRMTDRIARIKDVNG